jgi:hypothetical protein
MIAVDGLPAVTVEDDHPSRSLAGTSRGVPAHPFLARPGPGLETSLARYGKQHLFIVGSWVVYEEILASTQEQTSENGEKDKAHR